MMNTVTLQIWNALKRPPIHHPLFQRSSQTRARGPMRQLSRLQRIALAAILLILAYIFIVHYLSLVMVAIFFIPITIAAIYMALHGTVAGLYWSIRVSGAIAREHARGTYELISVSPYGAFSASWAICTGCQYYDQTFKGLGAQRVWFSRTIFLTLVMLSAVISLADPHSFAAAPAQGFITLAEAVVILALAFRIDDIHSTVIGSLVGLIVPLLARNRFDARVGAFIGFLLLQIFAYLLVWVIGFQLMPQVNASLIADSFAAKLVLPLEQLLVFFLVCELIARVLWGLNSLLLNGDVSDLRLLTKGGRLIC